MTRYLLATFAALTMGAVAAQAQAPATVPTTAVLVSLTVKPDINRQDLMKVMPDEVRETLKLYLDGKIQQWYSRADGRGVMFILNASTVDAAKTIMNGLPLSKANMTNLEYTALGPLSPLRALISPPSQPSQDRR